MTLAAFAKGPLKHGAWLIARGNQKGLPGIYCRKKVSGRIIVRRALGLILFWVAVGMLLMMLIGNNIVGVILVAVCLIIGYNLFCL